MLRGRAAEQARIDAALDAARAGDSAVLMLRGEAGIGKTALLEYAIESAEGMTVITATGAESETNLPFAGLHLLIGGVIGDRPGDGRGRVDLPAPQREALERAFGRRAGSPSGVAGPDRLLIGFATLSVLASLAETAPVLCVVDDAQWMDAETLEALHFAARRLGSDRVALLFGARLGPPGLLAGLPDLTLSGLASMDAAALLDDVCPDLSAARRYRVLSEAEGNPLALLELPATVHDAGVSSAFSGLSERLRDAFAGQADALPGSVRAALLVAAIEGAGDLRAVLRAMSRLGSSPGALAEAERAGLIRIGGERLRFRHPLIRAAIADDADFLARRAAHVALAEALTDPEDADRRAHHLAAAAIGPDEPVAAELERTAERAGSRHGHAAASRAYERAADLSPEPAARARRLTHAALVAAEAGDNARAGALADRAVMAAGGSLADGLTIELAAVRAEVQMAGGAPRTAHDTLLTGAATAISDDAPLAVALLAEAANLAWHAGDPDLAGATADRLDAIDLPQGHGVRPIADLVRWLMAVAADRPLPDGRHVSRMLDDARAVADTAALRLVVAGASMVAGAEQDAHDTAAALVADARTQGQLSVLPPALTYLAQTQLFTGRHREAEVTVSEARDLAGDLGLTQWLTLINGLLAYLAAIRGDEAACRAYADASVASASAILQTAHASWAQWALSVSDLGAGRAEAALDRLDALTASAVRRQIAPSRALPDLVEAAARLGRPDRATAALERLERWASTVCQSYQAHARRARALVSSDQDAEAHFVAALELHDAHRQPFERARTELLYGEWLRRMRRRNDARLRLEGALFVFERLGASPWAERARIEAQASGATAPRSAAPDVLADLTPQEARIVQLAARGLSNKDIAAQLFLSPRTVGFHLYKAYPKLGVLSRGELATLLPDD